MRAKFKGVEYVIEEITPTGIAHALINEVGYMNHLGSMPSLQLGWSTTPQVYLGKTGLFVTSVVGASRAINWIATMTPVEEVIAHFQNLLR